MACTSSARPATPTGWREVAANYCVLARLFPKATPRSTGPLVRALDYGAHSGLFGRERFGRPHRDPARLEPGSRRAETCGRLGSTASPAEPPLAQVFPARRAGLLRTEWKPGADYLAFDASTWGGGHGHLSRYSFVLPLRRAGAGGGPRDYQLRDERPPGRLRQIHRRP